MSSTEGAVLDSSVLAQWTPGRVHRDLPVSQPLAISLARGESKLAVNGALVAYTGARTGRSPKDKFIIQADRTRDRVKWGNVNPRELRQVRCAG